jgi:hypothetical protein
MDALARPPFAEYSLKPVDFSRRNAGKDRFGDSIGELGGSE